MNRRAFVKRALVAPPLLLGAGLGYARYEERHAVQVVPVDIALGLPHPLQVALLSDIHFDPLFETEYLESVVARTNALSPDLILFTGDFVSDEAARLSDLADILAKTTAPLGRFAILGNHDHTVAPQLVGSALELAGITLLRNRTVPIPGMELWHLTGLESFWRGRPDPTCITRTRAETRHIVLAHEPDSFDRLGDSRIALQLSGHTHGGQIRMPYWGAIQLPSWGKKYQAGLYEHDDRKLYVNKGIGTVVHHYRFNCPPEITLLRLS